MRWTMGAALGKGGEGLTLLTAVCRKRGQRETRGNKRSVKM